MAAVVYYVDEDVDRRSRIDVADADLTFLSRRLREEAGNRVMGPRPVRRIARRPGLRVVLRVRQVDFNFSWMTPRFHGLGSWDRGETPVAPTVNQRLQGLCIPFATYNLLRLQINVMMKFAPVGTVVPQVSLDYLVYAFKSLPEHEQNFERFLYRLHHEGFLTTEDYDANGVMALNLRWYFIHFCKFIRPEEHTVLGFENEVRRSILYYGGVLTEIPVPQFEDIDPKGDVVGGVEVPALLDQHGRTIGHALLLLGWRVKDGIVKLLYQNSYGERWGLEANYGANVKGFGLVRSSDLHHVYVPQLKQWKVFSFTFHNGVSRAITVLSNSAGNWGGQDTMILAEKLHQRDERCYCTRTKTSMWKRDQQLYNVIKLSKGFTR